MLRQREFAGSACYQLFGRAAPRIRPCVTGSVCLWESACAPCLFVRVDGAAFFFTKTIAPSLKCRDRDFVHAGPSA